MHKCPKCNFQNNKLIKQWDYGPNKIPEAKVHVERYKCMKCGSTYRAWIGRNKTTVVLESKKK
jgi:uncharacterized protein with PIN domain